jgi:hypothetical protein
VWVGQAFLPAGIRAGRNACPTQAKAVGACDLQQFRRRKNWWIVTFGDFACSFLLNLVQQQNAPSPILV